MSEPKTYTASDIERYHSGSMPPAEMHRLEKAALDDPFLADMLEGYRFTSTAAADLQTLQAKLQQRINDEAPNRSRVIALPWLRVAALFVLLVGGIWLLFRFSFSSGYQPKMSQKRMEKTDVPVRAEPSAPVTVQATAPATAADSTSRTTDVALNRPKSMPQSAMERPRPKVNSEAEKNDETAAILSKDVAAGISVMRAEKNQQDSMHDLVVINDKAVAPAARSAADTSRHLNIVMKKLDLPVEEVVVNKEKQRPTSRYQPPVAIDSLEPERGWSSFDSYVAENLKAPDDVTKKAAVPEVELSFSVDREGNPVNIKVTKSLCEKCDSEAIRLLKEGPKWKGKKGKIKIRFPQSP